MRKPHFYRGTWIEPCERAEGEHKGSWVIPIYHKGTGLLYSDELCPHFRTIVEAKAGINRMTSTLAWLGVTEAVNDGKAHSTCYVGGVRNG